MKIRDAYRLTKQPAASLSDFLPVCSPAILPIVLKLVRCLEIMQNAWLLSLPTTQLSSLAGVKPG